MTALVMCGVSMVPHPETPTCEFPHYVAPSADLPSMTATETLDPRDAVAA